MLKKETTGKLTNHFGENSNSILTTLKFNGKSKSVDDFNVLEEYYSRFSEQPHTVQIIHDDGQFFKLDQIKKEMLKSFPKSKLIYRDSYFDVKTNLSQTSREVWFIETGYIMNIYANSSSVFYTNPEVDVKLGKDVELISSNYLISPPPESKNYNPNIEKNIFDIFNQSVVNEISKNSIGLISVDNGNLYVREFTIDKKVKITDLDLHYGTGFEEFNKELIKKLTHDDKGLVLLHGLPGTGKTTYIRYLLQRLQKINKKVLYFPPTMVESITDPSFFNFITDWTLENGKRTILLIEDAEPLLSSRNTSRNLGITNLLNLTDGILNDILSIQIIATFNTDVNDLDDALLRPERLIARKEFHKLKKDDCKSIAVKIGLDPEVIKHDMSLAELYSLKNNNEIMNHGIQNNSTSIGFKTQNDKKTK
jgi:hypothetical protein